MDIQPSVPTTEVYMAAIAPSSVLYPPLSADVSQIPGERAARASERALRGDEYVYRVPAREITRHGD